MFKISLKIELLKTVSILAVIILYITSCTPHQKIRFSEISQLPSDSAILKIEEEKTEYQWVNLCNQYISNLSAKTEDSNALKPMVKYLFNRSKKENSVLGIEGYYRFKSYQFITLGELDSALTYGYKVLSLKNSHDSINPCDAYHLLGMAYFYKNQNSDSARYYWSKGYKESELKKDYHLIIHFGVNLGTYYYNIGNTHNARSLFLRAKEIAMKTNLDNGILVNNIINTFMDEGQFDKADKFWNDNRKVLTSDLNVYKGQLFLINRINLLQHLNQYEEARQQLNLLSPDSVSFTLEQPYTRIYLANQIHFKDYGFITDSLWRNRLLNDAPYYCSTLSPYIATIDNQKMEFFLKRIIQICSDTNELNDISYAQRVSMFNYIGNYYFEKKSSKAAEYFKKSIEFKREAEKDEVNTQRKVIDELNELGINFKEIKEKEQIIQDKEKTQNILIIALVLTIIIFTLSIWITFNYLKIKKIEKNRLQNEQDALKREQEFSNRIVEYSKSIINLNSKLKAEILEAVAKAPNTVKNSVNQVLKDYQISHFNTGENPQIANQLIREKDNWNQQFPGFDNLNKTEQRVFVLTMENYRPKEIANVLGVSTQYVRNVKSRLKTKLNLKEDWGA